jgi:hypothetical protein
MKSWAMTAPYDLPQIKAWMQSENILTIDDFIKKLPADLLSEYTLMHTSQSLHEASFQNPRAILFGDKAQWIVSFNGNTSQNAGRMIEMMIYDAKTKKYAFHEIEFSETDVKVKENPSKCLSCHGKEPRPIWDHYNRWPGAYGDNDDRFNEAEFAELQTFIASASGHPRYQHLKNLAAGYKPTFPGVRQGMTERSLKDHNRAFTLKLYHQHISDLADSMRADPKFAVVKPLALYFLTKCYVDPSVRMYGDGSILSDEGPVNNIMTLLSKGQTAKLNSPFLPEFSLDYIFSRLGFNTNDWYFNTRTLVTYNVLRDGSDRAHETWTNHLLIGDVDYSSQYKKSAVDFQSITLTFAEVIDKTKTCAQLEHDAQAAVTLMASSPHEVPVPNPAGGMQESRVCRGFMNRDCQTVYKTLPPMCLKCHTQESQDYSRIYIPFQNFPSLAQIGNTAILTRMKNYISSVNGMSPRMPMRSTGDDAVYTTFKSRDLPKLKKYLDDLLKTK